MASASDTEKSSCADISDRHTDIAAENARRKRQKSPGEATASGISTEPEPPGTVGLGPSPPKRQKRKIERKGTSSSSPRLTSKKKPVSGGSKRNRKLRPTDHSQSTIPSFFPPITCSNQQPELPVVSSQIQPSLLDSDLPNQSLVQELSSISVNDASNVPGQATCGNWFDTQASKHHADLPLQQSDYSSTSIGESDNDQQVTPKVQLLVTNDDSTCEVAGQGESPLPKPRESDSDDYNKPSQSKGRSKVSFRGGKRSSIKKHSSLPPTQPKITIFFEPVSSEIADKKSGSTDSKVESEPTKAKVRMTDTSSEAQDSENQYSADTDERSELDSTDRHPAASTSTNSTLPEGAPKKKRRRRCGRCDHCLKADCGLCKNCLDKKGARRRKKACSERPACNQWNTQESTSEYNAGDENYKEEYEEAIRTGYVEIDATKVSFTGVPGSGKSTLCLLILDKPPAEKRTSTPVATKATQATAVYDGTLVSSIDLETWRAVDRSKLLEMICEKLQSKQYKQDPIPITLTQKGTLGANDVPLATSSIRDDVPKESSGQKMSALREKLRGLLKKKQQSRKGKKALKLEHLVYIVDVGGQIQFQEIVPLFVRNASVNVIILKLCTELQSKPKNEYFIDGNELTEPEHMVLSVEEFILSTTRSVFSQKPKLDIDQVIEAPKEPKVVLIGTFADEQDKCQETREDKEKKLRSEDNVFSEHIHQNHVITCDRKKLILDIDGSKDGYASVANKKKLKQLRKAILTQASKLKVKVPLAWYLLLLDIQAEAEKYNFITLQKCYELGIEWKIETVGIDAALRYFDELNLILYFPSTCPGLVFCNPQFLLKKVTDMIVASFPASAPDIDTMFGSRATFRREGLFSRELFTSSEYLVGFNDDFTQDHLLDLMQELLIIAKVNKDLQGNEQFIMPCVLELESSTNLNDIDIHKFLIEPLFIAFSSDYSPRGLFCATIVSLIQAYPKNLSKYQWVITSTSKGSLVRKRNKVEFDILDPSLSTNSKLDSNIGTVTLEDNFQMFIIYTSCEESACAHIYHALQASLDDATDKLSYEGYKVGFLCTQCKQKHHALVTGDYHWRCERAHGIKKTKQPLTEKQRPWFSDMLQKNASSSDTVAIGRHIEGAQSGARTPKCPSTIWKLEAFHNHGLDGKGTTIAIIDGGIDSTHNCLCEKWKQGLIDGYNFVPGFLQMNVPDNWHGQNAKDSHGTAVAAVCGGCAYTIGNDVVPNGIAPKAGLYICRVYQNNQTRNEYVHAALEHIINLHKSNNIHVDVLCMSFKLPGKDEGIESLLFQLAKEGVVCVAASGNDGLYQKGITFPASDPHVLSVGALEPLGEVSRLNPSDKSDVYAPGEDLILPNLENQNIVDVQDGTSYSTPMVAGFLSLLSQCANETQSPNVIRKYHDVKFLKELFNNPALCDKRKLLRVPEFLSSILDQKIDLISLIREIYPDFSP